MSPHYVDIVTCVNQTIRHHKGSLKATLQEKLLSDSKKVQ